MRELIVAAALVVVACGSSPSTTSNPPPTGSTTTVSTTTTSTSTTRATTTTTTLAEDWMVEGRAYYFPVQPPDSAQYGRAHHDYPATDIFAPVGTAVVAVTAGVIHEVSTADIWDPSVNDPTTRGGLFVSLVGEDGVRYYYSHLDSVEVGMGSGVRVVAGQRIGTVGKTGNAASTSPHVHFGISRPGGPGDWEIRRGQIWPWPLLDAWKLGIDEAPNLDD